MEPDRQVRRQERKEEDDSLRVPPVADKDSELEEFLRKFREMGLELRAKHASLPKGPDLVMLYADELVAAYQEHPQGWVAKFMAGRREESIRVLTHLAIRNDSLGRYLEAIKIIPVAGEHHDPALREFILRGRDEFPLEEVMAHGPGVLSGEQLARMSADATELETFSEYLDELLDTAGCGSYWYDAVINDVDVLVRPEPPAS